ncbi:SIS domain-containing protein [Leifsonia sp. L25]|uniref:SIS domain-containing protein n=1 Tax=Actinomycetes TaxID=1760 RepID=UPI003D69CBC4
MHKIPFIQAVRSQPEALSLALASLRKSLDAGPIAPLQPSETVGVIAMGASGHAAHAFVAVLAEAGVRCVNLTASDLELAAPGYQPADHYLVVSESGQSPEPIAAARALSAGRRLGLTNDADAPLKEVIDGTLFLGGFDDSPVYTAGFTATLLAFGIWAERHGVGTGEDFDAIPALVEGALAEFPRLAAEVGVLAAAAPAIDCVGRGVSFSSAAETALMFREGLRTPSGAYETYQYLHGPMEAMSEGDLVVIFGDGRELSIPGSVLDAGVKVVLVTSAPESSIPAAGHPGLTIVPIAAELGGFSRAVVEVVFAQLVLAASVEHKSFPIEDFLYHQDDTKLNRLTAAE